MMLLTILMKEHETRNKIFPYRGRFPQLAVPITFMLLWSEYNYHYSLELSKVPR